MMYYRDKFDIPLSALTTRGILWHTLVYCDISSLLHYLWPILTSSGLLWHPLVLPNTIRHTVTSHGLLWCPLTSHKISLKTWVFPRELRLPFISNGRLSYIYYILSGIYNNIFYNLLWNSLEWCCLLWYSLVYMTYLRLLSHSLVLHHALHLLQAFFASTATTTTTTVTSCQ